MPQLAAETPERLPLQQVAKRAELGMAGPLGGVVEQDLGFLEVVVVDGGAGCQIEAADLLEPLVSFKLIVEVGTQDRGTGQEYDRGTSQSAPVAAQAPVEPAEDGLARMTKRQVIG